MKKCVHGNQPEFLVLGGEYFHFTSLSPTFFMYVMRTMAYILGSAKLLGLVFLAFRVDFLKVAPSFPFRTLFDLPIHSKWFVFCPHLHPLLVPLLPDLFFLLLQNNFSMNLSQLHWPVYHAPLPRHGTILHRFYPLIWT